MDGIEVDSFVMKALRSLKDFKQGALLENSLFSASYRTSPELDQIATGVQINNLIHEAIVSQMAKAMIDAFKDHIEVTSIDEFPGVKNHKLELMIMPVQNLKHVVEYCIRQIPEEALSTIRKNSHEESHE